ncbi:uncharacterized protein J4E88_000348 [Alternaria novae-zelandiae]|uniref:uncharacterized protein n=1 Tax=Alternaria novae-zelandiae TaxID=430562 RepID=UPI0020C50652|nr:uncharacterized protein J4E88_000348 [Alternaria novae-zelandiae]KAI4696176.1 hypothetical protein J4E88_000348 [Alternaria novae-zelandiae]
MQEVDRDCELDDREPEPRYIPELSNAIERFLDAPYGSQLVLRFFAGILSQREADEYCLVYTPTPQRYDDVCATIPELVDPEAPQFQTRQSVRRVLPGIFYRGQYSHVVDEYIHQTDLMSGEVLWDKGRGYTTVTRGVKWLVECALIRLPDGVAYYAGARTALQQLLTPQPKYNDSRDYRGEEEYCQTMTAIQPALRLFTMWSRCDEASIASLLDIVMDITLNVVAIWERTPCFYPSYATYLGGFVQARARFKDIIQATPPLRGNQTKALPYHTRFALKEIKFRDIWDDLWIEAFANIEQPIGDRMYQGMINQFAEATIQSGSHTVDMKTLLRGLWRDGGLKFRTWKEIPEAAASLSADGIRKGEFGGIPRNMAQAQTIGTDCYHVEDIDAFWSAKSDELVAASAGASSAVYARSVQNINGQNTADVSEDQDNLDTNTLRNVYGKAYLEAYGPCIQPLEYGKWDLDIPQDQLCVVCLETHGLLGARMSPCGHYFHFACIKRWMNGTSPNSNLCPECRAQICNERKKVRMTGWMADSEDDEDEEDDFADDEDEESDYDDEDEDDSMLEQLEGDAMRDWRAEQERRNRTGLQSTLGQH